MSKKSFLIRFACLAFAGLTMLASCKKDDSEPDGDSGLYLGIIGFNSEQTQYKISPLNSNTASRFENFIDGLTMDDGTNLFHAVNTGMDNLKDFKTPEDLINVSIVTFTDGLDLTSYKRNPDFATKGNSAYLSAVHNRVLTEKKGKVNLSSYVIGLRGSDIRDEETHTRFVSDLEDLSSDAENNVFEVQDMSEAMKCFAEIAKKLHSQSVSVGATLKIPADINEHICITFDNANSVEKSTHYLTGVYNREQRDGKLVGKLTEVSYHGVKSTSGSTVYAVGEKGDFDLFQFDNLTDEQTGNPVSIGENVDQWRKQASASSWVHNKEFNSKEDATTNETFHSALIMLVLDCSTSLDNDFPKLQSAAKTFIGTLVGNYKTDGTGGDNLYIPGGFVDLGLSVKWASCNLGANYPWEYGDYFAWGETTTKSSYTGSNSRWYGVDFSSLKNQGVIDENDNLTAAYDVAQATGNGRMPTLAEIKELNERCTWKWTTQNGVNGYKVTGPNGRSIFLPAAGFRYDSNSNSVGSNGYYWSSAAYFNSDGAYELYFYSDDYYWKSYSDRDDGKSVRPVMK